MTSESGPRPTSFPIEEYRDLSDDNPCDNNTEDIRDEDDVPMLQAAPGVRVRRFLIPVIPEVVAFLYFMSMVTLGPVQQFWLFDHFSDMYNWKQNETSSCSHGSNISSNISNVENQVQAKTNEYVMYNSFISSFTAIFPTLFLGPLTDKFGRKFVFYISMAALGACDLVTLMVFYFNLTPTLLFLGSFIQGLSGSYGLFLAAIFGMIADITSAKKQRTFRVATSEAAIAIAASIGLTTSGIWVKQIGYVWPMVACIALVFTATLFVFFFIPETFTERPYQPFSCRNFVKCFELYVKDTANNRRFTLIVCLIAFMICTWSSSGEVNFKMLFLLHLPFCWPKMQITVVSGMSILVGWGVVMCFIHVCRRWISEPVFALIGCLSIAAYCVLMGVAKSNMFIYAGIGLSLLAALVSPMCRCIMSKAVSAHEQGSLFSSIGVIQLIVSAVSGIVMSNIYAASLDVFLGLPYLVLAALTLLSVCLLVALLVHKKRHPDQGQMEERIIN